MDRQSVLVILTTICQHLVIVRTHSPPTYQAPSVNNAPGTGYGKLAVTPKPYNTHQTQNNKSSLTTVHYRSYSYHPLLPEPPVLGCSDWKNDCKKWAKYGECEKNPQFMLEFCPKACWICKAFAYLPRPCGLGFINPSLTPFYSLPVPMRPPLKIEAPSAASLVMYGQGQQGHGYSTYGAAMGPRPAYGPGHPLIMPTNQPHIMPFKVTGQQGVILGRKKRQNGFCVVANPGKIIVGGPTVERFGIQTSQECAQICLQRTNLNFNCKAAVYYAAGQQCLLYSYDSNDRPDLVTNPKAGVTATLFEVRSGAACGPANVQGSHGGSPRCPCLDLASDCYFWMLGGQCSLNPDWMLVNCRISCRACRYDSLFG